jgi:hypothetical protein
VTITATIRTDAEMPTVLSFRRLLLFALLLTVGACRAPSKPPVGREMAWRRLGSWSGHGNTQTESFASDTGSMRVQWKTTKETPPGAGTFRLAINSSISGRTLQVTVDRRGVGADTAYIQEDPRVFFAVVESANLDWSFTVEEAVTR